MRELPLSYLDKMVGKGIDGTRVELYGKSYELKVEPFRKPGTGSRIPITMVSKATSGWSREHPPGRGGRALSRQR